MISVVIPVKNGGESLRRCLEAIRSQEIDEEVEILIVDSGSTDGSQQVGRTFGASVHEISPGDFNHGRTRNLGAALAAGEIIVFTVQDALPVGRNWIEALVAPLRADRNLAGSYSRQIADPAAAPHQHFYIEFRYGSVAREQRAEGPHELTVANTLFSNVSSAIRASLLQRFPFPSDLVTAEDLEWCSRVLLAGYAVAYVPGSVIQHSHDYSLRDLFRRYFDQGAAAERSYMAEDRSPSASVRRDGLNFVRQELAWMWAGKRRRHIPYTLLHELTRYLAFQLGARSRKLPPALSSRLSGLPTHWDG